MMSKLKIIFLSIVGELIKLLYKLHICRPLYGLNVADSRKHKVIVSLTSYGRRVSAVLPYTIYSLLRQTYKPDVIILWLDYDSWNERNLPSSIRKLQKYGLTIKFCNDIKSYKKLIPTLKLYPDEIIITVDDDIYYKKNMVERLIKEYQKDSSCIYTHRAHKISINAEGNLLPYNEWKEEISDEVGRNVFPTGGAGCLYKRSMLYKDICSEELFMKLAPKADDVWFYFMVILQTTNCKVLPYRGYIYFPLDAFYQHFHQGASLASTNCNESQNDVQIKAVMDYYGLTVTDLGT